MVLKEKCDTYTNQILKVSPSRKITIFSPLMKTIDLFIIVIPLQQCYSVFGGHWTPDMVLLTLFIWKQQLCILAKEVKIKKNNNKIKTKTKQETKQNKTKQNNNNNNKTVLLLLTFDLGFCGQNDACKYARHVHLKA